MSTNEERQELINDLKSKFGEYVEKYFEAFDSAGKKSTYGMPSITQVEELWQKTNKETRELLVSMVEDSINSVDESEIIESKKENTPKGE
ncbi:MAG: hypothetical protein IJ708_11330 [Clostridia bacterium]|nr:hypothetical protein [Clostridia bacterium]